VFQYRDAEVGREASRLGIDLLHYLLPEDLRPDDAPDEDWDFGEVRDEFIRSAQNRALGPSTGSMVKAAEERDIPWIRLNRFSLVQFGHGRYQQTRKIPTRCCATWVSPCPTSDWYTTHAPPYVRRNASATRSSSSRCAETTVAVCR
jgi:cyanophycin synthetase